MSIVSLRTLLAWQRATTISAGLARRGRIIFLLADGVPITAIAATVGVSRRFIYTWAKRFVQERLDLLSTPLTNPLICCHIKSFRRASSCGEAMARRRK
jgi:hypothetical protein